MKEMDRIIQKIKDNAGNVGVILIAILAGTFLFGFFMVTLSCMLKLLFITYQWLEF